jgi:CheY-like chemotaxis protein
VLAGRGHEIAVAYDGASALRTAAAFHPTVALLDIGMPGMTGYELASLLRGDASLAGVFLVAITGWGQEEDRRQALAAGFDAHLTKPADPDRILHLVDTRFQAP